MAGDRRLARCPAWETMNKEPSRNPSCVDVKTGLRVVGGTCPSFLWGCAGRKSGFGVVAGSLKTASDVHASVLVVFGTVPPLSCNRPGSLVEVAMPCVA